jgi:uncharacterized repeat protein (TIGR01451 family)
MRYNSHMRVIARVAIVLVTVAVLGIGSAGRAERLTATFSMTAPPTATVGSNFDYMIESKVSSDDTAPPKGINFTDPLPAQVQFVSARTTQGACQGGQTVDCTIGDLSAGSDVVVTVTVKALKEGQAHNEATWSGTTLPPNRVRASAVTVIGPAGPPPPVEGKSVNVGVASGTVACRRGSASFAKVTATTSFGVGEECDTTKGVLVLTSAAAGGKTQTGTFSGGRIRITQTTGAVPVTVLTLSGPLVPCTDCRIPSRVGAARKKERHVFGKGKGHFETRGKYAKAGVKGTSWEVQDTADATVVRVTSGTVTVTDSVKRKTVTIGPHQTYVAKAKGK